MSKDWKEYNKISKEIMPKKELNDLSGSEWAQLSKSVQKFDGGIAKKRREHGAAFPLSLAKHFIKIYTKVGDCVLDPFLGVGTTLDAAKLLGRNGIGFEINSRFAELANAGIEEIDKSEDDFTEETEQKIILGNCLDIKKYVKNNSIDLILTSPPYSNLLNNTIEEFGGTDYTKNIYKTSKRKIAKPYSVDVNDFGNLNWDNFCKNISKLMGLLFKVAQEGSYNVWVVRDYRDMPEGIPYINLHGKIIEIANAVGWILIDIIIWDQSGQRKLVKLGGKISRRFYFNIGHSYVVVFRKSIRGERFGNSK